MKITKIALLYTSDDPENFVNYKPISVLPLFLKTAESITFNILYEHLKISDPLTENQSALNLNNSTDLLIFQITRKITGKTIKNILYSCF